MKILFALFVVFYSLASVGDEVCSSLFDKNLISSGEAKELFDFLTKLNISTQAFEHNYQNVVVRRSPYNGNYSIDFSKIYNNKNELRNLQRALRADGFRSDHRIFSRNLDISNPIFKRNQMTSDQAKEISVFLFSNLEPYGGFAREYFKLIIGKNAHTGNYYVDYSNLQNRAELRFIQATLRYYDFPNLNNPIFNDL